MENDELGGGRVSILTEQLCFSQGGRGLMAVMQGCCLDAGLTVVFDIKLSGAVDFSFPLGWASSN